MPDVHDQLELWLKTEGRHFDVSSCTGAACVVDHILDAYRRSLVEECCAGAVVGSFGDHVPGFRPTPWIPAFDRHVPIAAAPASLAEKVAEWLARGFGECTSCPHYIDDGRVSGCAEAHVARSGLHVCAARLPPFAAAYTDAGGVRAYTLVARDACSECGSTTAGPDSARWFCECGANGTHADVGVIARRYGGEGKALVAQFTVRS